MFCAIRNTLRVPVARVARLFHKTAPQATEKFNHKNIPADDEGVQGEKIVDLDSVLKAKQNLFPTLTSEDQLFSGTQYKRLPVCNIRVSHNNTIFTLTDPDGVVKAIRSCGIEGFKNTKKGTNIAAQTTAISIATKAIEKGFKTVRVRMKGLGPGRLVSNSRLYKCIKQAILYETFSSTQTAQVHIPEPKAAVKGLQMGGLDIVSVTDNTPVSWNPPRPRKARRL